MFFEIVLFAGLGIFFGFLAGMIPGLHPNTIFMITLSILTPLLGIPLYALIAFITSLAVSNTFFDFIPTILFGAPEEDAVLSILPGHKLLLEGRGHEAIMLVTGGGMCVMMLTILSLPFLFVFIPLLYSFIRPLMHVILAVLVLWMIVTEKRRIFAVIVLALSGALGVICLNSFPSEMVIFPALTGLFGMSTVLTSMMMKTKIPRQKVCREVKADWMRGSVTGWLAGVLAGLLPGIGSSQAGIVAAQFLKARRREFLISLGGINTSNIFFTFVVFYAIGKTRSGAVWALSQIAEHFTVFDVWIIMSTGILAASVSSLLTLGAGRILTKRISGISYPKMMCSVLFLLVVMVAVLSGPIGLLISLGGMFTGLLAIFTGVRRTHLMGFLLLPTILYFSHAGPVLLTILW